MNKHIKSTQARNDMMRMSARFVNDTGFVNEKVFVNEGYFIQCRWFTDEYGLDWRIVMVQEVDCSEGSTVGTDNQTWYMRVCLTDCLLLNPSAAAYRLQFVVFAFSRSCMRLCTFA